MDDASSFFANAERLTRIFGYWPSFHDAEVLELNLSRGGNGAEVGGDNAPILTARIYVFEMTSKVRSGRFVLRNHTRVTLRFEGVDGLELDGFNHQNALNALSFELVPRTDGGPSLLAVTFDPAYGLGASFTCRSAEVVEAEACSAPVR
ncbi:hypothetical protein F0U61_42585 [Archangium violaceum]|uniref:Imm50 family immunity protein n=1 Tax=Archangium violaceum TaxID=83451 RepID=UPI002B2A9928|nr:hypothetical protein F0U61_42585 [Archangium violaceum]